MNQVTATPTTAAPPADEPQAELRAVSDGQAAGMFLSGVPLAWHNLTHDLRRLLASVAGVTFAVLIMFVQVGFLYGLLDSATAPLRKITGDVIITSRLRNTLLVPERFTHQRLRQAEAVPGVAEVRPLYIQGGTPWRDDKTGLLHPLRVLAVDPERPALQLDSEEARALVGELTLPGTALFDRASKIVYFGNPQPGLTTELAGQSIRLIGLMTLGTDFANDGNVLVGERTFMRLFPYLAEEGNLPLVDLGVVIVQPGADPDEVRDRLNEIWQTEFESAADAEAVRKEADVIVRTRAEMIDAEERFWFRSTPVGMIFGLGTAVGFLVGIVICYQILFSEVTDHTAEFATIKAMGYGPQFLASIILKEALILSVLGFAVGLLVAAGLYSWLAAVTGLQMTLTLGRATCVGLLTMAMCIASGLVTVRKVFNLDPADLF